MNTIHASPEIRAGLASLGAALGSTDPIIREKSRIDLVATGSEAVVPLVQKLKDPVDRVCSEAAKTLGVIGDPAAASALAETLDHPNHDVRWVAAEALVALDRDGLKQVLILLLTRANSVGVLSSAHHVLARFAVRNSGDFLFLSARLEKFNAFEPAGAIPPAALRALHELQDREPLTRKG
jgi:HEAT repeat protein